MAGKHSAKKIAKRAEAHLQRHIKAQKKTGRSVGIGDIVHPIGRPRERGVIIGWDMRDPAGVIYYVKEKKK